MPYLITEDNCVHKRNPDGTPGEQIACHETREEAEAQLGALNISESGKGMIKAFKGENGEWMLDVLGVPYGGPHRGKDAQGEAFTPETDLWLERIPKRPVVYYHGLDESDRTPQIIGEEISWERKPDGVWFKVLLDKTSALARQVWEAAQLGLARASSGAISHLVRVTKDGVIKTWPIGEMSLLDAREHRPVNAYAIARPAAKAQILYRQAGIEWPDQFNETQREEPREPERVRGVGSEGDEKAKKTIKSRSKIMAMSAEELSAILEPMLANFASALVEQLTQERPPEEGEEAMRAQNEEEEEEAQKAMIKAMLDEALRLAGRDTGVQDANEDELEARIKAVLSGYQEDLYAKGADAYFGKIARNKEAAIKAVEAARLKAKMDAPPVSKVKGGVTPDKDRLKSINHVGGAQEPTIKAMIADHMAGKAAVDYEIGPAGGYVLRQQIRDELLPELRSKLVLERAGATVTEVPDDATVTIPKMTRSPAAFWVGSNNAVPDDNAEDQQIILNPKAIAALVRVPFKWLNTAFPSAERRIREEIVKSIQLEIDRAGLLGTGGVTGSNSGAEPLGLTLTPGIESTTLGTNGRKPVQKDMSNAKAAIQANDVEIDSSGGWIMHPNGVNYFEDQTDANGQPIPLSSFNKGFDFHDTTLVPTDLTVGSNSDNSQIFFGRWNYMEIALGGAIEIRVLQERYADNLQVGLLAYTYADVGFHYPDAFYVMNGVRYS
jgi:HK97 family phage major capsid protein